ncbi:DUF2254 domain-containing protein [Microlunatus antarcticus]|nr:DUF2254 domain-containing protein [Microlunatus antarcticus]
MPSRLLLLLRNTVRDRLWPIPVLGVVLAIVGGQLVPRLDAAVDGRLPGWLDAVAFGGDAGAAQTVLDAVGSSLITVTSLTFSLTVVTLQLASSQFSPRLLRTFTQDLFVQVTLAVFLATFAFSLTVLRSVRSEAESTQPFVPRLAVTCSYLMAMVSVVALVLFLAHLTRQIRVETMLGTVCRDARSTLAAVLPPLAEGERWPVAPTVPPDARTVLAHGSGFLLRLDRRRLVAAAAEADLVLLVDRPIGSFLVEGTPLGRLWRSDGSAPSSADEDRLRRALDRAVRLGPERTSTEDLAYGLRQLTDVANKALSPGINDPTTAVHAVVRTGELLADLGRHELGSRVLDDDEGTVRLVVASPGFDELLDAAVTPSRRFGAADSRVLGALYQLLADVAWNARPEHRDAIRQQARRLDQTAAAQDFDEEQRTGLTAARQGVDRALDEPVPGGPPA